MSRAEIDNFAFNLRKGTPEYVPPQERLQAAEALRERLSSVPFYAKGAERARKAGDEMAYWLRLQSSQATAHRP